MARLIVFASRHPLALGLLILLVTVAAASRLGGLRFELSTESMMAKDDPGRAFYRQTLDTFGADTVTVVFLSDPGLFRPDKLQAVRAALRTIEALPFVERTESLFSVPHLKSVEGFVSADPYLKALPERVEEAEAVKAAALRNPFVAGNLLADSGTAMALNLYIRADRRDAGFDARVAEGIDRALAPLQGTLEQAFQIGSPYVRAAIRDKIFEDQRRVLPVAVLILLITLALGLRSLAGVLIPFLTVGLGVVWTLGAMAALDIPLTVMTSIVPVLLIVIGSTEAIYLIAEYRVAVGEGLARPQAIARMADAMGTAVLLTFITTCFGFLSIALNEVELLRQFGLVAATGLLLNFVLTLSLVPVCLRLIGARPAPAARGNRADPAGRGADRALTGILARGRWILALAVGVTLAGAYGAASLRVSNAPLDYFDETSPVLQRVSALRQLGGNETYSVVLGSGIEGTFLKPRYLEELWAVQTYLAGTGQVGKSLSFADYVALVDGAMEERPEGQPRLPESEDIVREYMNILGHERARSLVSADYSGARILVRHAIGESAELGRALKGLRAFLDQRVDPGLRSRITGESVLTQRAADALGGTQIQSLALMLAAICVIVSLLFVTPRAGLVAVGANLLPIAVLFGVMGYGGIPLDTGTAMVGAVALGICVNNTIHFMVRFHARTRGPGDANAALAETLGREFLPIASAALALAVGFAALTLSAFPPVVRFGMLSALVLGVALVSTFVITPVLLSKIRLITLWDLLSVRVKARFMEHCPLFRGMRPWQIKKIVLISTVREYPAGRCIVRQGETGEEMFVLLEGSAEVRMTRGEGPPRRIRDLASGDPFGEIALVSRVARTADVVAVEDSRVLVFRWEGLERIARIFPRISARLYRNLAALLGEKLAQTRS